MNAAVLQAIVRHVLTLVAGGFFAKYGVDGSTVDAIVGGVSAVVAVGWSVYDKKKTA